MKLLRDNALAIGDLTYLLIAVVTFGHAAANSKREPSPYSEMGHPSERKALDGLAAAFVWPLYWSWEAFDHG